jgi:hypothetical protein
MQRSREKNALLPGLGTAAGGPANNPPVNPEVLKSVEAWIKSEWLNHQPQMFKIPPKMPGTA